jgi:hypothetical protein
MACCQGWSQLVHVVTELLYEEDASTFGGWYQELTGDLEGLTIDELC